MENGLPRKIHRRPERVKISDILNFTSAVITVVTSAIFYFTGWVYVAHWYSYYGIDASQLDIPIHLIVVHGVPGVLILTFAALIVVAVFSIWKRRVKKTTLDINDLPGLVLSAYLVAILFLFVFIDLYAPELRKSVNFYQLIPFEATISVVGVFLVFAVFNFVSDGAIARGLRSSNRERIVPGGGKLARRISFAVTYESIKRYFKKTNRSATNQKADWLTSALIPTWQFWLGAMLLLYFLVSVSVSAILGEWDAKDGRKSMVGAWQGEAAYIFSSRGDLALPFDLSRANARTNTYVYGPFMILGKHENMYYLTDWPNEFPYTRKPNIYVASIPEDTFLGIQMVAPTPIPIILGAAYITRTPTIMPTGTASPTPTATAVPTFSATPSPLPAFTPTP